jgi:hypothetical protein
MKYTFLVVYKNNGSNVLQKYTKRLNIQVKEEKR